MISDLKMLSVLLLITIVFASDGLAPHEVPLFNSGTTDTPAQEPTDTSSLATSVSDEDQAPRPPNTAMQRINAALQKMKEANHKSCLCGALVGSIITGTICLLSPASHNFVGSQPLHFQPELGGPIIYRTTQTTTTNAFPGLIRWNPRPREEPMRMYCPSGPEDFYNDGGSVRFFNGGWHIGNGYGRVRGKTAFDLLGGSIQLKMNVQNAQPQVNTNFYTVSPRINDWNVFSKYCDIQSGEWEPCMELDIIENNGKCKFQTTVHTEPIWGSPNCDRGGCAIGADIQNDEIEIAASWDEDGTMHVYYHGQEINPPQTDVSKEVLKNTMKDNGALIVSSQWTGWVPSEGECPQGSNLGGSSFQITDLKVQGRYKHGVRPKPCPEEENVHV